MIRMRRSGEPLPWELLLMADEEVRAIERYIYNCVIFLSVNGEEITGECAVQKTGHEVAEIMSIAVAPAYRQQGLGRKLLRTAVAWAEKQQLRYVDIGTADTSVIPLAFYRSEGFTDFGIRENFFAENYTKPVVENGKQCVDMIVLRKRIKKDPD